MKRVFRTDDESPGTITSITRVDGAGCQCFRGVGELAGQDECTCATVDHSDPSGPKFRRTPMGASSPTADDRARAMRDHEDAMIRRGGTVHDAHESPLERAKREMTERNNARATPGAIVPAPTTNHADANESPLERAKREMTERNAAKWQRRF